MTRRLLARAAVVGYPARAEVTVIEGAETGKGFAHDEAPTTSRKPVPAFDGWCFVIISRITREESITSFLSFRITYDVIPLG